MFPEEFSGWIRVANSSQSRLPRLCQGAPIDLEITRHFAFKFDHRDVSILFKFLIGADF